MTTPRPTYPADVKRDAVELARSMRVGWHQVSSASLVLEDDRYPFVNSDVPYVRKVLRIEHVARGRTLLVEPPRV